MIAPYILFQAGSLKFLILMEDVAVIEPSKKVLDKNIPVYDFDRICGLRQHGSKRDYMLVLKLDKIRIGITAEMVEGIRYIPDEEVLALKAPALCEKNRFLTGAIQMAESRPPLAYILDTSGLYAKAADIEPDYFV